MCYARRQRSSWARIKLSKSLYQNILPDDSICFRVLLLASFTFCLSSILIQRIFEIRSHILICFVLLSCCSIFKDHSVSALRGDLVIIPHPFRLVNPFFKSFFNFFQGFFTIPLWSLALRSCGQLAYYIITGFICQDIFCIFLSFVCLNSLYTTFNAPI